MSVPLIIYTGESNSGGRALNSSASSGEIASRSSVQIFNNNTMAGFENLNIGLGNNLYGHAGLIPYIGVEHSWELQMANRVDAGGFIPSPCYLVKTGQGGTTISQWDVGGTYSGVNCWQTMQDRLDAAIPMVTALTGSAPRLYIFYSQGINDGIAGTDINTWKAKTLAHIDKIRAKYGANIPFVMTKFSSTYAAINTAIDQVITQRDNLFAVDTLDCTMRDENHWDYAGQKTVSNRVINSLIANTDIIGPIPGTSSRFKNTLIQLFQISR